MHELLTRNIFRTTVLQRNGGVCCVPECDLVAVDAHHILNRNLFVDVDEFGGYFYDNGAQLCSQHHYDAEVTRISVEELRSFCKITVPVLPHHFKAEEQYDCWGNLLQDNGYRVAGELFTNDGCQKALKNGGVLWKVLPYSY